MRRVVVVGCSGAGKSTLATRIADVLGAPHIELDALHWGPDWTPASADELSAKVRQATTGAAWVVDGNYQGKIGSLAWELADAVVWVDPPRPTVMWRSISRTMRRVVTRAELWSGNREHWRGLLFWRGETSIVWWAWTSYARNRERYEAAMLDPGNRRLTFHRLTTRHEVERFLQALQSPPAPDAGRRSPLE